MFRRSIRASSFHLALALTLGSAVLASAQEPDSEVSRHFLDARKAQASGDLKVAAQEYLAVIRLQPNLAEARVNLGLVYYLQAQYGESAEALEKALSLKPGLRGADLFLGIDLVKLGQSRRAVAYLKRAAAQEPRNKQVSTWLGTALWDAGQESEAILELRDAEKAFPADPDILFLLGQAYRNAGDEDMDRVLTAVGTPLYHQAYGDIYKEEHAWKQALGHYKRALEKDPKWPGAHLGLGEVYLQHGELDKARSEFLAERATGSTSASATARLAEIVLRQDQPEEALRLLNDAIQKDPDAASSALGLPPLPFADKASLSEDAMTKYRESVKTLQNLPSTPACSLALAFVDLQLGLSGDSAQEWQRYHPAMPSQSPGGDGIEGALREFERHDFEDARSHLIDFLSAHPHDMQARYLLAKTSHSLSLSVLAHMLSAAPDSPRTHQLMGQALAEREDNEKALAEYRIVEAAAPTLGGVHFAIGELLWKMNQADAAMAEFQQELHLNPGHAEASAAAGTILVREHQADQAVPYLERAIQLRPGLQRAHQELGQAFYNRREFVKAEAELIKALGDDPEGNVHYLLGNVYKQLGQNEKASAAFAESRRIKAERLNAVNMESGEQ
jgi:tetratricopeptide (TPR) repeat protein